MDVVDEKILNDVQDHGWHVIKVLEDAVGPGFAYSIGFFENFGHPEVLIFGLEPNLMHQIINIAGDEIRKGKQFSAGISCDEFLENYRCIFRKVPQRWYKSYVGCALWYYKNRTFQLLQCFWPDKEGKYPWEEGFSPYWKGKQPLLFQY